MKAVPFARRLSPHSIRILDAHNVDHKLVEQEWAAHPERAVNAWERRILQQTRRTEQHLERFVHGVWACSEPDRVDLAPNGGPIGFVIPNGVDCSFFAFDSAPTKPQSPFIVFSGWLGTEANQDAVAWLLRALWPRIRAKCLNLSLLLVGGGMPAALGEEARGVPGIEVVGEVSDVRPYFRKASVAIVPLRIGSGTRFKILEAMAQGNPVLSTRKGAEGLDTTEGENILLADEPGSFIESVFRLLSDSALFNRLRYAARAFVERRYDWDVVGNMVNQALEDLFKRYGRKASR